MGVGEFAVVVVVRVVLVGWLAGLWVGLTLGWAVSRWIDNEC